MEDWELEHELDNGDGSMCYQLSQKESEGLAHWMAYYHSPTEIYFELWYDGEHIEGGLSWNEVVNYDYEALEAELEAENQGTGIEMRG